MKSNINLHIHTTHSDGAKSVEEIIEGLRAAGVDTFAITDHDCVDGNLEAEVLCKKYNMMRYNGVELSCRFDGEIGLDESFTVHILGYDFDNEKMEQVLKEINIKREIALRELCDELAKSGYKLPEIQVDDLKRTYLAKLLVNAGYFSSNEEAYKKCLNTDAFKRFARTYSTIKEGIALLKVIVEGVAVWAHPFTATRGNKVDLTESQVLELVEKMVEYGIEGIEVYCQNHTTDQTIFLENIAKKYNLATSVGTDYHGVPIDKIGAPKYAKRINEEHYFEASGITPSVTILDYIKSKREIKKVIELTGGARKKIKLHNDGYWSRAYVVNGGEFVVKFPKYDCVDYSVEARFLDFINAHNPPINMQRVKLLAEDNSFIAFCGVKGTPLSELKNLSLEQKSDICKQLANFLKLAHSLKLDDIGGQNLNFEIESYKLRYAESSSFFNKYLSKEEKEILDFLMLEYFPRKRIVLGEKIVLCHGDVWDPNIFIDESGKVGIIDCANAGYYEEATDFCFYDENLRKLLLDHYGADEVLHKKVELKYAMSVIVSPKYIIETDGEAVAVKTYLPLIREVILKYKECKRSKRGERQ